MENTIKLKEYLLRHYGFYFCDMKLFQFDRPNDTILVTRTSIKCNQSLEDFIIQSLLVQCCEDNYMKKEYIFIEDKRMDGLDTFLFSKEVGGKEEFTLYPITKENGIALLRTWIGTHDMKKLNISFDEIDLFLSIGKFDSMNQEMVFEDNQYRFFLSRGLG